GINRVVQHFARQRPSFLNYGSGGVVADPSRLCVQVQPDPVLLQRQNPLVGLGPVLPVIGTNGAYQVDYAAQVTALEVDFSPGNIALPAELNPPLDDQSWAVHATVCGGLGCPPEDADQLLRPVR